MAKKPMKKIILLEELLKILNSLIKESSYGIPIIVEGSRDEETLRRIGVRGEIISIKSIKGLRRMLEKRDLRRVILLMDLDSEGENLMKAVAKSLEGVVKEVDISYWRKLRIFKRIGLTQIESLDKLVENLSRKHASF